MKKIVFLIVAMFSLSSCKDFLKNDIEVQGEKDEAALQAYIKTQSKYSFLKSESNAYYAITQTNDQGKKVATGDEVTFFYKIGILNGAHVDSVSESKNEPAQVIFTGSAFLINLGRTSDIASNLPGLAEGIVRTKEGERSIGLIPSAWAFGSSAIGSLIPANSSLKIDLKILKIRPELQQVNEYVEEFTKANKLTVTESSEDGFRLIKTASSPGDAVKIGSKVTVKYAGYLVRGTKFDEGEFTFITNAGGAISGFDRAVLKMKVGEKAKTVFVSALGYGKTGSTKIPPYSPLMFDLEIVKQE